MVSRCFLAPAGPCADLWIEIYYERLMRYNDEDGFEGEDVWDADTGRLEGGYKPYSAHPPLKRPASKLRSVAAGSRDKKAYPRSRSRRTTPGTAGLRRQRRRRTCSQRRCPKRRRTPSSGVTVLGLKSSSEKTSRDGFNTRTPSRLEVRGDPNWTEYEKQGRLELFYDETTIVQGFRHP